MYTVGNILTELTILHAEHFFTFRFSVQTPQQSLKSPLEKINERKKPTIHYIGMVVHQGSIARHRLQACNWCHKLQLTLKHFVGDQNTASNLPAEAIYTLTEYGESCWFTPLTNRATIKLCSIRYYKERGRERGEGGGGGRR